MVQFIIAVVFIFAALLVWVFVHKSFTGINDALQADEELSPESKAMVQNAADAYPSVFDGILVFVFVSLWIMCLVLAYNAGSNPVLVVFIILIIAFVGVAGMILSNAWSDVSSDAQLASAAADFPKMSFIVNHYLVVVLAMGFSTVLVGVGRGGSL